MITIQQIQDLIKNYVKRFFKSVGLKELSSCPTYTGGETLVYNPGTKSWNIMPANESLAMVVNRNRESDFILAHGTGCYNNRLFVGTRADGSIPRKFLSYNPNNLKEFVSITLPFTAPGIGGIECLTYNNITNQVYATLSNTSKLFIANADDITDYQIVDITLTSPIFFQSSCAIMTDNTYIYVGCEMFPTGYFVKIRISDFVVVSEVEWVGRTGSHAGIHDKDTNTGYFTSGGANPHMAKLNLNTMTYTEVALGISGIADDVVYTSLTENGYGNYFVAISDDTQINTPHLGAVVNTDTMIVSHFNALPPFGLFWDAHNLRILTTCVDGFIEEIPIQILHEISEGLAPTRYQTYVYSLREGSPNELMIYNPGPDQKIFITLWEGITIYLPDASNNDNGNLLEIVLARAYNPLITKKRCVIDSHLYLFNLNLNYKMIHLKDIAASITEPSKQQFSFDKWVINRLAAYDNVPTITCCSPKQLMISKSFIVKRTPDGDKAFFNLEDWLRKTLLNWGVIYQPDIDAICCNEKKVQHILKSYLYSGTNTKNLISLEKRLKEILDYYDIKPDYIDPCCN